MSNRRMSSVSAVSMVLAVVLVAIAPVVNAASDKDVRVINTTAEPVPTVAQGTTAVDGSVSITNTPTVTLSPGASVNVGNSASAPIPIVDMNDGRQPFQASTFVVHPNGTNVDTMSVATVPAGKRLVIEFISVSAQVPPGQHLELATVQTLAGGHGAAHQLLIHAQPDAVIGDAIYRAVQELRLYADPGSTVQVLVRRNSGLGQATFGVTISGYFVNL